MAEGTSNEAKLYGRKIFLTATRRQDLPELQARPSEDDNARLFRHTYETTGREIGLILDTPEQSSNTYTIFSRTTHRAIGWILFRLLEDYVECTEFVSRRGRPELSTELLSLLGTIAFEQLKRDLLHVKVGASDVSFGETANQLGNSLIGIMARQMLQSGGKDQDFSLYTIDQAHWPAAKEALDAWLDAQ